MLQPGLFNPTARFDCFQHLQHCQEIVHNCGLQLLQRVVESRPKDLDIKKTVARIVGNLAVCTDLHKDIINTGLLEETFSFKEQYRVAQTRSKTGVHCTYRNTLGTVIVMVLIETHAQSCPCHFKLR